MDRQKDGDRYIDLEKADFKFLAMFATYVDEYQVMNLLFSIDQFDRFYDDRY